MAHSGCEILVDIARFCHQQLDNLTMIALAAIYIYKQCTSDEAVISGFYFVACDSPTVLAGSVGRET